jgi:hypothetical protein
VRSPPTGATVLRMRAWRSVPILLLALAAAGCGGDGPSGDGGARATSGTEAAATTTGPRKAATEAATGTTRAADPASRVRGWPAAFCRVRVGSSRAVAARAMGPPTETVVRASGRQDVWEHYEVRLVAAYAPGGAVRTLRDGSGDSRLPCSARRDGDARLDRYAAAYQRGCNTVLRAQDRHERDSAHASAAKTVEGNARLARRAVARTLNTYRGATRRMLAADPPPGFARTQRRVRGLLPDDASAREVVRQLRSGVRPQPKVGISMLHLKLPKRLLAVAPNCEDMR